MPPRQVPQAPRPHGPRAAAPHAAPHAAPRPAPRAPRPAVRGCRKVLRLAVAGRKAQGPGEMEG